MSQDHSKLKVFVLADELVVEIYSATKTLPPDERFGLQSQLRRAAVSVPTNIVEGCGRRSSKELRQFVQTALGSASEVRYLIDLCRRLEFVDSEKATILHARYDELVRSLQSFLHRIDAEAR